VLTHAATRGLAAAEAATSLVSVQLLGEFDLRSDGVGIELPRPAQKMVAFAALRGASRLQATRALFPDSDNTHAMGRLRTTLWRLRRACPDLLAESRQLVHLAPAVSVDVTRLIRWARDAARGIVVETSFTEIGNWDLLPDFDDDWISVDRQRLHEMRIHALTDAAEQLRKEDRFGAALQAALACVAEDPLRESGQRAAIEIYLAEGNIDAAVRQYRQFAELLHVELRVPPSVGLTRLLRQHGVPTQQHGGMARRRQVMPVESARTSRPRNRPNDRPRQPATRAL
jgi:DNA-binding SARP family transcriptional activator